MNYFDQDSDGRPVWHPPVVETVDDFRGWKAIGFERWKNGVQRVTVIKRNGALVCREMWFAKDRLVTTARELGILQR